MMRLDSLVSPSLLFSLVLFTSSSNAQNYILLESTRELPKREERDSGSHSYFPFYAIISRREDLVPEYIPTIKPRDNPEPNLKPGKTCSNQVDYARKILSG